MQVSGVAQWCVVELGIGGHRFNSGLSQSSRAQVKLGIMDSRQTSSDVQTDCHISRLLKLSLRDPGCQGSRILALGIQLP